MTRASGDAPKSYPALRGLYLILDQRWASRCSFRDILRQAADVGVRLVQYRNKEGSMDEMYRHALALQKIARDLNMLFIVNDRCDLGLAVGADGVHLGQSDLTIDLARKVLGTRGLIGVSTHSPEQVVEATMRGADYLGFGPIFPTATKKDHEPVVGIEGIKQVRSLSSLPVFAIGGIQPESVQEILHAGANGVAVASGVCGATDPRRALSRFMKPMQSRATPALE